MTTSQTQFNPAQALQSQAFGPGSRVATQQTPPGSFRNILNGTLAGPADDPHSPAAIRKVAGDLVAQALILPLLKQLRRGTFGKGTPLSPGTGEKTFGPEFDVEMADRIAHSPRMAPTDAIAARLTQRISQQATRNPGVDLNG